MLLDDSKNKPSWLKVKQVHGERLYALKRTVRQAHLHTVCEEAKCPNISECWNGGTATFMVLGDVCTRACRFCHVKTGNPEGLLDPLEPLHLAETIAAMELDYAVITMVNRDDLPDFGAAHLVACIEAVRRRTPATRVELLAGDFRGAEEPLRRVLGAGLDVFAHNLETVRRRTPRVRDARAGYDQSLRVLENAKRMGVGYTKSALMLGVGEERDEVEQALRDLRAVGVDIVTLGQYLRPTKMHLKVHRWVAPEEFAEWERFAREIGFLAVASGPLVRSSYRAGELFPKA